MAGTFSDFSDISRYNSRDCGSQWLGEDVSHAADSVGFVVAAESAGRSNDWLAGLELLAFDHMSWVLSVEALRTSHSYPHDAAHRKQPGSAVHGHVRQVKVFRRSCGCRWM